MTIHKSKRWQWRRAWAGGLVEFIMDEHLVRVPMEAMELMARELAPYTGTRSWARGCYHTARPNPAIRCTLSRICGDDPVEHQSGAPAGADPAQSRSGKRCPARTVPRRSHRSRGPISLPLRAFARGSDNSNRQARQAERRSSAASFRRPASRPMMHHQRLLPGKRILPHICPGAEHSQPYLSWLARTLSQTISGDIRQFRLTKQNESGNTVLIVDTKTGDIWKWFEGISGNNQGGSGIRDEGAAIPGGAPGEIVARQGFGVPTIQRPPNAR